MRKLFSFFYIACIFLALVYFFAPPFIISTAKKSITGVLPGSAADIKSCSFWPLGSCTLSGIEIRRAGVYNIAIPAVTARIKASAILSGLSIEIYIKGIVVSFRELSIGIADITRYVRLQPAGRPFLPVGNIRLAGIRLDVQTGDARLLTTGSLVLRAAGKGLQEVSLHVPVMEYSGVNITNGSINALARKRGRFSIEKLSAGKLTIRDISANAGVDNNTILLEDLSGRMLGGSIRGSGRITLDAGMPYEAVVSAEGLNLSVFVADFDLKERLELSGIADGAMSVKGSAGKFSHLTGDLNTRSPGGVLNIKDQSTIDMIAQRSGQARDLISRSFTDYRYSQAQARLYAQDDKLILDVVFEGQMGKRGIQAVLHDFTIQGGEK